MRPYLIIWFACFFASAFFIYAAGAFITLELSWIFSTEPHGRFGFLLGQFLFWFVLGLVFSFMYEGCENERRREAKLSK